MTDQTKTFPADTPFANMTVDQAREYVGDLFLIAHHCDDYTRHNAEIAHARGMEALLQHLIAAMDSKAVLD